MYVVSRPSGWEVRESVATSSGPRSRTLATFRVLDDRTAAKALERARGGGKLEEVRAAARRAGAPVAAGPALSAAGALVAGMSEGARLPSNWAAVLRREIGEAGGEATASELAASAWMLATPERHGEALRDLLLLSDRIPRRRRGELRFPPLARA